MDPKDMNVEDIVEYWIPDHLKGGLLPETDIQIPEEVIGLYADCPLGLDPQSKDSFAEITFYDKSGYHSGASFDRPFFEFERIAKKFLILNE